MPAPFNPNEAILFFTAEELPASTFTVASFRGEEAISQPFQFEFDLQSVEADVEVADVVGKKATFKVLDRTVHGLVSEFEYQGFTADKHRYRAVLVPHLWALSLRYDNELFLQVGAVDLIRTVLDDCGVQYKLELSGVFAPKEVFTQYQETDLAFISRIAEHLGISYRFEHVGGGDVVTFFNRSTDAPELQGESTFKFEADESLVDEAPTVVEFIETERMVTSKIIVKDYNYRTPETALVSEGEVDEGTRGSHYFEYGTHHSNQGEGDAMAQVRREEIASRRKVFRGRSDQPGLAPGYHFTLEGHRREAMNGKYLVTSVKHRGAHRFATTTGVAPEALPYQNEFTCIPLSVPYRPPRRTPIPKVAGIMTARTETAGGPYAHVDEEGRYRVKMPFDLSDKSGGEASSSLRMSQPYSGAGYGMHFPNHANTELVWACVNGDPDRPIILGSVPNPSNGSPVSSGNKAQNVIRTMGGNEITMDDTQGGEMFFVHASKDNLIDVVNNQEVTIGANRTITVGGAHTESIGGSMTLDVGASSSETVGVSKTVTVGAAMSVSVGAVLSETVGGAKTEQVGGMSSESVGAAKTLSVGGVLTTTVGGAIIETVGGPKMQKVQGALISKVGGAMVTQVAAAAVIKAKAIVLKADDVVLIKCGGSSIMLMPGKIQIKSEAIQVKSSGNVVVKGSQVKIN